MKLDGTGIDCCFEKVDGMAHPVGVAGLNAGDRPSCRICRDAITCVSHVQIQLGLVLSALRFERPGLLSWLRDLTSSPRGEGSEWTNSNGSNSGARMTLLRVLMRQLRGAICESEQPANGKGISDVRRLLYVFP